MREGTFPFSRQADMGGTATIRVPRPNCIEPLSLQFQFDVAAADAGILRGTVSSPRIYSRLSGNRLAAELQRRGWAADPLAGRRKGDREKVQMARRLRGEATTCLPAGR